MMTKKAVVSDRRVSLWWDYLAPALIMLTFLALGLATMDGLYGAIDERLGHTDFASLVYPLFSVIAMFVYVIPPVWLCLHGLPKIEPKE